MKLVLYFEDGTIQNVGGFRDHLAALEQAKEWVRGTKEIAFKGDENESVLYKVFPLSRLTSIDVVEDSVDEKE